MKPWTLLVFFSVNINPFVHGPPLIMIYHLQRKFNRRLKNVNNWLFSSTVPRCEQLVVNVKDIIRFLQCQYQPIRLWSNRDYDPSSSIVDPKM
jgi:hypothetical protein